MAEIIIDIDSSLYARGFEDNERIHRDAVNKAKSLIDKQLLKAKELEKDKDIIKDDTSDFIRHYNTISILGERGVGKTSFLLSLRKEYLPKEDVIMLPLIDPTLFEEKGHLFLLIITLIDDMVKTKLSKNNDDKFLLSYYDSYVAVRQQLAQGLPTLDNDGMTYSEPQWHEDEYMMERGMESVKSAFNLERNFHQMVKNALQILQAKAFMIMFDDIDVDFKKGWMVLETLRKFLTTPQLIILLSGNMKLYSKNIRKQQWRNFGKELLLNEMEADIIGRKEYTRLVNEIEEQYMQKVLKSENRVFLYTINENILINRAEYKVKYKEEENPVTLQQAYTDILKKNGIVGPAVSAIFISFLMSTSMRTQIHFLYNMHHNDGNDLISKISAFTSRMYAQNIDVDLIINHQQFNIALLHYLIQNEIIEEAYQLIPSFENLDINSALTGFSCIFSHLVSDDPSLIFDYWCRICVPRNNMRYLSYEAESSNNVDRYCIGAAVYQSRDLRNIVGYSMAFLASLQNNTSKHDGAVPILGFGETAKGTGRDLSRRIDKVLSQATSIQKFLGYLPLTTLLFEAKNSRLLYYSVYSLLANIGQILSANDEETTKLAVKNACVPINFQVRAFEVNSSNDVNEIVPDTEINIEDDTILSVVEAILHWKKQYMDKSIGYGTYLFGRIATRFFYSLINIVENNKREPLGKVFNLFVASLLNSCLIEESNINKNIHLEGININNISTSTKILADNIAKLNGVKLPFTEWISSCPLIYPYVNPTENPAIMGYIRRCCEGQVFNEALLTDEGCMSGILDKVACLYQKNKSPFSASNANIEKTVRLINENRLDVGIIMNGEKEAAVQELNEIFISVTPLSLQRLRSKCQINNGSLKLKPIENK